MSSDTQLLLMNISGSTIIFLVPAICLFWRLPKGTTKFSAARPLASIGIGWLLLIFHRAYVELPIISARRHSEGDMMYDGVAGNAATLLLGWFPMLFVTLIYVGFAYLWWKLRRRTEQGPSR